jgi:hypothetical protein
LIAIGSVRPEGAGAAIVKQLASQLPGAFSSGNSLDFAGQIAELQDPHVDFGARIVDVDSHKISASVIVDEDAFGNFSTLDAHLFRELDVQRVCVGKIVEFHGRNLRSGNALRGHLIFKRNHPQVSAAQLRNRRPKPVSIVFLRLTSNCIPEDIGAPFLLQVRPAAQDNALQIGCETKFLHRAQNGEAGALQSVFEITYEELRLLARGRLQGAGRMASLDTTALVHECYLRFATAKRIAVEDRVHFFRYAGRAMRSVIVDLARGRCARSGGVARIRFR